MNEEEVRALIQAACARLYRRHRTLIDCRAHERTIAGRLAGHLESLFDGWDVDADYNREGNAGAPKHGERGLIVPDIIIHRRGQRRGANEVAMKMKGYWNQEDRRIDDGRRVRLPILVQVGIRAGRGSAHSRRAGEWRRSGGVARSGAYGLRCVT
jgi:hypothetical protein